MTEQEREMDLLIGDLQRENADLKRERDGFKEALESILAISELALWDRQPQRTGEVVQAKQTTGGGGIAVRAKDRQVGGDHYKNMGVEPWDVVDSWPREQRIGYYRGGALKYIMRMGSKDVSAQEVAKGQHYIQKLLEVLNERDD